MISTIPKLQASIGHSETKTDYIQIFSFLKGPLKIGHLYHEGYGKLRNYKYNPSNCKKFPEYHISQSLENPWPDFNTYTDA